MFAQLSAIDFAIGIDDNRTYSLDETEVFSLIQEEKEENSPGIASLVDRPRRHCRTMP